jgi:hypothetical protein
MRNIQNHYSAKYCKHFIRSIVDHWPAHLTVSIFADKGPFIIVSTVEEAVFLPSAFSQFAILTDAVELLLNARQSELLPPHIVDVSAHCAADTGCCVSVMAAGELLSEVSGY